MKKLGFILATQAFLLSSSAFALPTVNFTNSHSNTDFNLSNNILSTTRSNAQLNFTDILGFNNGNGQTQLSNLHLTNSPLSNGTVKGTTTGGNLNLYDNIGSFILGAELNNGVLSNTGNGRYQLNASNVNLSGAVSGAYHNGVADLVLYFEGLPQATYAREQTGSETVSTTVQGVIGQKTVNNTRTEAYTESITKFKTENRQESFTAYRTESYSQTQNTGRTCFNFKGSVSGKGWTGGCFFANEIGNAAYNKMREDIGNILRANGDLIASKQCFLASTSPNDPRCNLEPNISSYVETNDVSLTHEVPYIAFRTVTDTIPYNDLVTKYRGVNYTTYQDIFGPITTYSSNAVFGDVFKGYNWNSFLVGGQIVGQNCPAIPEPATLGLGLTALALIKRRRKVS